jgi:hypothetical protein
MTDNFVKYIGVLTTGIMFVDADFKVEVTRQEEAFLVKSRKLIPDTKKVVSSSVLRGDVELSNLRPEALEHVILTDIKKLTYLIEDEIVVVKDREQP